MSIERLSHMTCMWYWLQESLSFERLKTSCCWNCSSKAIKTWNNFDWNQSVCSIRYDLQESRRFKVWITFSHLKQLNQKWHPSSNLSSSFSKKWKETKVTRYSSDISFFEIMCSQWNSSCNCLQVSLRMSSSLSLSIWNVRSIVCLLKLRQSNSQTSKQVTWDATQERREQKEVVQFLLKDLWHNSLKKQV